MTERVTLLSICFPVNAQTVVRFRHLHAGGAVVHLDQHPAHQGQHHHDNEPFYGVGEFFIFRIPLFLISGAAELPRPGQQGSGIGGRGRCDPVRAWRAPRATASASAKRARQVSVRSFQPEKPSGAMWAPRRSPARQSCRWAARACPDRPFRRGSRRRNRSPRTRSPARWHCPRER